MDKNNYDFNEACSFVLEMGKRAHAYGSSASRLESYLVRLSTALGINAEFRSTPTDMIFAFNKTGEEWQQLQLATVPLGGFDMTKLAKLDGLVDEIIAGELTIAAARKELQAFDSVKEPFGMFWSGASYLFAGVGFAAILSGGWMDILFSGLLSLLVFFMVTTSGRLPRWWANWLPVTSAFVVAFISIIIKYYIPELNTVLVTLCAIIILIPGYSVSTGIAELTNNHVVSGWANLINGLVYLLKQFSGAWLGFALAALLITVPSATTTSIDSAWLWLFVPVLFLSLPIAFQTSSKDFIWALISCAVAYAGVVYGSMLLSSNLGNLLGAIFAGVFANAWEWKTKRPGSIVLVPALMVLVSGSIGFRGLMASAEGETAGLSEFLDMFIIAITLTAGFLIANTLVKPKHSL